MKASYDKSIVLVLLCYVFRDILICYIFFCLAGRKCHFCSRRPIAKVVFSASPGKKIVYAPREQIKNYLFSPRLRLEWQFTCDLGHSLLLLPRCVIYYFTIPGPKMPKFEFLSRKRKWYFRVGYCAKNIIESISIYIWLVIRRIFCTTHLAIKSCWRTSLNGKYD